MIISIIILLVVLIILTGILLAMSPGKPAPFLNDKGEPVSGSISEKTWVEINGLKQGMFIKGKNINNPVLLYLHGGMPDYFLTEKYPTGMDEYFTVVWWEQRGSGISYSANIPPETMNLEQMIADTISVTNYLRKRFGQEKIYLMGHSGGTFIGIQTAARKPDLYHAYIGVAQMADQLESERLAYEYMLNEFGKQGDSAMVSKLEAAPVNKENGTPMAYRQIRDTGMHRLGIGTTRDMKSVVTGIFLPSLASRDYTLMEKIHTWTGKAKSGVSVLWDEMIRTDLAESTPELQIPVYFLHGVYDYTCSYPVAKGYFDTLSAPLKGFYTFNKSAHSPIFEEPERVQTIIREDILYGTNKLADFK
jgi:pimeloyl-ACP methyl ester carboxylesterase